MEMDLPMYIFFSLKSPAPNTMGTWADRAM